VHRREPLSVGVSSVGTGVGQGIVKSLRLSGLPVRITGFGNNPYAYAAADCDDAALLSPISDPGYVDALLENCRARAIDLIIPSWDDELPPLALEADRFRDAGIRLVIADQRLIRACRDKRHLTDDFADTADLFARSFTPEEPRDALRRGLLHLPLIGKPWAGMASRGVAIIATTEDLNLLGEADVIQEIAFPHRGHPDHDAYRAAIKRGENMQVAEASIQLVADREGNVLGCLATENTLVDGVPRTVRALEDDRMWDAVDRLVPALRTLGLRGPVNIQGRLTDQRLQIFEINPRFTGLSGVRALMGFNEVAACVTAFSVGFPQGPVLRRHSARVGVRRVEDRIVRSVTGGNSSRPRIILSGATGLLGRAFVEHALEWADVVAVCRDRASAHLVLPKAAPLEVIEVSDVLLDGGIFAYVDAFFHAAFARPHRGDAEVADTLQFSKDLFVRAVAHQVPRILNISSQSVYGSGGNGHRTESDAVAPTTPYGHAKYASELLLVGLASAAPYLEVASLRLGTLAGCDDRELLFRLSTQALRGGPIKVHSGESPVPRLDVRDAAAAMAAVLQMPSRVMRQVYNVGTQESHSLAVLARMVTEETARQAGVPAVALRRKDEPVETMLELDSGALRRDTGWRQ
jgi:nucleoside-diphosphate-sugar epimerase/carbamoylphosphate synthase large subunit